MLWNAFPLQQIRKVVGVNVTSCTFLGIVRLNVVRFHQSRKRWTLEVQRYQCMNDALLDALCYLRRALWDACPFPNSFYFICFTICTCHRLSRTNRTYVEFAHPCYLIVWVGVSTYVCVTYVGSASVKRRSKTCSLALGSICRRLSWHFHAP